MRKLSHNAKPKTKFLGGEAPWYVGMELEMEAPTSEAHIAGLGVIKSPKYYYAKHDGSLQNGWELVTHPINPELWLNHSNKTLIGTSMVPGHRGYGPVGRTLTLVQFLRNIGYTSYDNARCGLHLHVSRTAFGNADGGLKTSRFYWFSRLVNGPLFRQLSQRGDDELNRWAKQVRVTAGNFADNTKVTPGSPARTGRRLGSRHRFRIPAQAAYVAGRCRYLAVNVTDATVEVRIFRGNMRPERIRKCVEAVIAAVEFAATRTSRDFRRDLDADFRGWVAVNAKRFPNLHAYMTTQMSATGPVAREEVAV